VSNEVEHKPFVLEEVLEMPFRTDVVQEHYVCIAHLEQLFESIQQLTEQWTTVIGN
jgi:phenylalanine-4-hydroxylase